MDEDHLKQEEADDLMINAAYERLINDYLNSRHRKKVDIITKAFHFARQAHKGVRRLSGEPYIMHPIAVAQIVCSEIGLGSTSICSALLHDVVEDTDYTVEDIENMFGPKIAQIVDGLTKISGGIFGEQASAQAENFKKLLLTMSEDIRVILIKIADRLHNMRTLESQPANKQYKIAGETLYLYYRWPTGSVSTKSSPNWRTSASGSSTPRNMPALSRNWRRHRPSVRNSSTSSPLPSRTCSRRWDSNTRFANA